MRELNLTGMRAYSFIWFGQFISLVGSAMTRFAITIWAYTETESATVLALVGFFSFVPIILLTPFAGVMVDRWNRKTVMIASDLIAGTGTIVMFMLLLSDSLQPWHLYVAGLLAGSAEAFQFPAFSAAITMLVDKKQYARVQGMQSLAQSASTVAAPFLAGIVLAFGGLHAVFMIDIVTFLVAVGLLGLIHIPQPQATIEGIQSRGSIFKEMGFGFSYIWRRPGLMGMQMMFFLLNLFATMGFILVAPLVLARTGNDEIALGTVQAFMGLGGVAGGLAMTTWGGPKRRVHGVFLGMAGTGLLGQMFMGLGQNVVMWSMAGFLSMFMLPIINGSNQAIWQSKVAPDVQGRVFAVRRLIAQITAPVGMFVAGILADTIFEPGMVEGGALAGVFGELVGTGTGTGIAVIFLITGALAAVSGLLGYALPFVREVETRLPDFEGVPENMVSNEPDSPTDEAGDAMPEAASA